MELYRCAAIKGVRAGIKGWQCGVDVWWKVKMYHHVVFTTKQSKLSLFFPPFKIVKNMLFTYLCGHDEYGK